MAAGVRYTTPPLPGVLNSKLLETPHTAPETQSSGYPSSGLKIKREKISLDASPKTRQVSAEYFLKYLLPPLHEKIKLATVIGKLKKNKVIKNGRLMSYSMNPVNKPGTEAQVFAPVERIVARMVQAATTKGMKATIKFFCVGNIAPTSENRDWASRPDIVGVRTPCRKADTPPWYSTGVTGEWKPDEHEGQKYDDELKEYGNMHICLCDDIRRRFTYGLTIENATMRMWFTTRAFVLVSDGFNFITDYLTTTHFFLSLVFAPEHLLGWDPTILRLSDPEPKFDITVFSGPSETRTFRTVKLISDRCADTMNGPGTRVWTVQEVRNGTVKPNAPCFTLKESWVEEDRSREGDILQNLQTAGPADENFRAVIDNFFLHVLCHGNVLVDGQPDTTTRMLRGASFPLESTRYQIFRPRKEAKKSAQGDSESPAEQKWAVLRETMLPTKTPGSLVHYRLVYEEVCEPLHTETSLKDIFITLCMACMAVQAMHEAGYVHRNLSTETIVREKSSGKVRLTSLHAAKRMDKTYAAHSERITALDFMAVEVQGGVYRFRQDISKTTFTLPVHALRDGHLASAGTHPMQVDPLLLRSLQEADATKTHSAGQHSFRYNPLHDLESLWWIAVYFLIKKQAVVDGTPCETPEEVEKYADELFVYRSERFSFLQSSHGCMVLRKFLDPKLASAVAKLDSIRNRLVDYYSRLESDPTQEVSVDVQSCDLYTFMGFRFQEIAYCDEISGISVQPREASTNNVPGSPSTIGAESTQDPSVFETESIDNVVILADKINDPPTTRIHKRPREDESLEDGQLKKLKSASR